MVEMTRRRNQTRGVNPAFVLGLGDGPRMETDEKRGFFFSKLVFFF